MIILGIKCVLGNRKRMLRSDIPLAVNESRCAKRQAMPILDLCYSNNSPTYPAPLERKHESPANIRRILVSASLLERRDPFPAWSGKDSRRSRRISRGGALHRKGERNTRVVPPFPESPRCLRPFQGNLFSLHCLAFQAEDGPTPRWHVGQPCWKASWESLKGKPQLL